MTKFYHVHVPKTGGTSLRSYAFTNKLDWPEEPSHRSFSERVIPQDSVTITCLRCPVRQTISVYSFWSNSVDLQKRFSLYIAPFSDWLRAEKDLVVDWPSGRWKWFPNLYVSFFGDGCFEKAVENIKTIDHVLDTSLLTEQFNKNVAARYNLPEFNIHVNTSASFEISDDDLNYIKKQRAEDFEICKIFGITTR